MFPTHRGTMDEMVRQYVRYAVGMGQGSVHEPRIRTQETDVVDRTAAFHHNLHQAHATTKREEPQRQRSVQETNTERTAAFHHNLYQAHPMMKREASPPQRQRADQGTNVERTPAFHHAYPMTKRDEPPRQRVVLPQLDEDDSVDRTISSRGRPIARRRRTTSINIINETPAERDKRLTYMRERRKQRIELETDEQKAARLVDTRERARQKLKTETLEEREKRLKYLRDHQRQRIKSETPEEREKRLLYLRERQKERIRNETPQQREKRLNRSRKHRKSASEPELDVDIREDVLYVRDAQCQVILTEPHPGSARDPLDLHDYQQNRQPPPPPQQHVVESIPNDKLMTIGHVWSLKPNTGVDDKLWYHNQL